MSYYYRGSGLTWEQYIQTQGFVDDITKGIKRTEKNIVSANKDTQREISKGFYQVEKVFSNSSREIR